MRFPGPICFLAAGLAVTAVAVSPRLAGLFGFTPDTVDTIFVATTEMVDDAAPPEKPAVALVQHQQPPAKPLAPTMTPRESAPARQQAPEPVRTSVAQLDPVGAAQPVHKAPQQMDIADALPEEAKRTFESLLEEGTRLNSEGATTPAYNATIPVALADRLIGIGVFRAGVTHNGRRLFVFAHGGLSDAQSPQLAGTADTTGWSSRVIALDRRWHATLVTQVAHRYGIPSGELTPCLLVRGQLDRVVLATQHQAAALHGLTLDQVVSTVGRFEYADGGVPFAYSITELNDKSGRRIVLGTDDRSTRAPGTGEHGQVGLRPATSSRAHSPAPGA